MDRCYIDECGISPAHTRHPAFPAAPYPPDCSEGLAAKAIVDYTRKAFVFGPGNVRVTLDSHIRTALRSTDFLNPHCATVPVPDSPCIHDPVGL